MLGACAPGSAFFPFSNVLPAARIAAGIEALLMAQQTLASHASSSRILAGAMGFFCSMSIPVGHTMNTLSVSDASLFL